MKAPVSEAEPKSAFGPVTVKCAWLPNAEELRLQHCRPELGFRRPGRGLRALLGNQSFHTCGQGSDREIGCAGVHFAFACPLTTFRCASRL